MISLINTFKNWFSTKDSVQHKQVSFSVLNELVGKTAISNASWTSVSTHLPFMFWPHMNISAWKVTCTWTCTNTNTCIYNLNKNKSKHQQQWKISVINLWWKLNSCSDKGDLWCHSIIYVQVTLLTPHASYLILIGNITLSILYV